MEPATFNLDAISSPKLDTTKDPCGEQQSIIEQISLPCSEHSLQLPELSILHPICKSSIFDIISLAILTMSPVHIFN